jgi:hypothetical protein
MRAISPRGRNIVPNRQGLATRLGGGRDHFSRLRSVSAMIINYAKSQLHEEQRCRSATPRLPPVLPQHEASAHQLPARSTTANHQLADPPLTSAEGQHDLPRF